MIIGIWKTGFEGTNFHDLAHQLCYSHGIDKVWSSWIVRTMNLCMQYVVETLRKNLKFERNVNFSNT